MDFPLEKIEEITSLYTLFQRRDMDTPAYLVIETACDHCEARDVLEFREKLKKMDPPGEEDLLF